jgi:ubiquinol-cytochrome c reductase cytochrome c subunit
MTRTDAMESMPLRRSDSTKKGHLVRATIMLGAVVGALACPAHANAQSAPTGDAEAGRQLLVRKGCYQCHGREGQGSPTAGPRLGPDPIPLAAFVRLARSPRAQMPPYTEKVVSDSELADIRAFLQTRPRATAIDALVPK